MADVNEVAVKCASHSNSNHGVQGLAKGELPIKVNTISVRLFIFFFHCDCKSPLIIDYLYIERNHSAGREAAYFTAFVHIHKCIAFMGSVLSFSQQILTTFNCTVVNARCSL